MSFGLRFDWVRKVDDFTHPVYASLYHPLFACGGKRGSSLQFPRVIARYEAISAQAGLVIKDHSV
jgi:hypothetical protein